MCVGAHLGWRKGRVRGHSHHMTHSCPHCTPRPWRTRLDPHPPWGQLSTVFQVERGRGRGPRARAAVSFLEHRRGLLLMPEVQVHPPGLWDSCHLPGEARSQPGWLTPYAYRIITSRENPGWWEVYCTAGAGLAEGDPLAQSSAQQTHTHRAGAGEASVPQTALDDSKQPGRCQLRP